jgi:catechol 2,3-dioxygenase-like lactoylglutathione lyase family enzyme
LGVSDLAASVAFYERLGWKQSSASVEGEVAFFLTAGCVIALFGRDTLAADAQVEAGPPGGFSGISLAICLADEAEVDAAMAAAEAAGAPILKPAQRAFWGGYHGYFADVDGYAWEIAHNPGFPFAPDGSLELPA